MRNPYSALNDDDINCFDYDFLPGSIKMIAEVIGLKEAKKIAAMMAGQEARRVTLYFSKGRISSGILKGVISDESIGKLINEFKGDKIDLTPCANWQKAKTKQLIHKLKAKQFTAKDIAKKTGFHLATVYRELARRRGER